ncbi:cupin domain-containing protein [Rhodoplanes elegans]|nr:cupin domain-containing protein [Rhodoplanes elegans]
MERDVTDQADAAGVPEIKSIAFDGIDLPYALLLKGPPETKSFRSGLVTLAPGKSIGVHNSGINEEMLVPLEGEGELRFPDRPALALRPGVVTYAPAHSEHDVINTGTGRLRYIFILARTE